VDDKFFGRHFFRSTFSRQTSRSTKDSRLGRKKNPWSAEQLEKRTADELAGRQIRQRLFCGRNPNAHNIVLASGGATVRFESPRLFTYFITCDRAQVFMPRPNASTRPLAATKILKETLQRFKYDKQTKT
jgi:hypothetical protein